AMPRAVCRNARVERGEECDDNNTAACDGCSAACTLEGCGNGMIACEACGDGNVVDGDGCDANRSVTARGHGPAAPCAAAATAASPPLGSWRSATTATPRRATAATRTATSRRHRPAATAPS